MISAFKRLLRSSSSSYSAPAPVESSRSATTSIVADETMVTTRGQKLAEEDASAVNTPVSTRKQGRRTGGNSATGTPVPAAKKTIPVRAKEQDKSTTVVVEIPVTSLPEVSDSRAEQRTGNKETTKTTETQNDEAAAEVDSSELKNSDKPAGKDHLDGPNSESVEEITREQAKSIQTSTSTRQASRRGIVPAKVFEAIKASEENTVEEKANADKNIKVIERVHITRTTPAKAIKEVSESQATPSKKINKSPKSVSAKKPSTATAKPKHKRFGSEDPEEEVEFFSTAPEKAESDDEESSDDDVVEEITAQDASKFAAAKERDAAMAIEQQENAARSKRQEREATLKKQADAANKKRKRESEIEERRAKKSVLEDSIIEDAPSSNKKLRIASPRDAMDLDVAERSALPNFLLGEDDQSIISSLPGSNKKISSEKKVKDRRKGSTTYRVAEKTISKLAPKADSTSRHAKELWMQNREGKGASLKRTPWRAGFFKNGKPDPPRSTLPRRHKPGRN